MLNHKGIKKDLQRITNIKLFINKYKWEGKNVPLEKDDWEKNDKSNVTIALTVLYAKKYILLFRNITQIVRNKLFFS